MQQRTPTDPAGEQAGHPLEPLIPVVALILGALAFAAACFYGPQEGYAAPAIGIAGIEMWLFIHATRGLPGHITARIIAGVSLLAILARSFL